MNESTGENTQVTVIGAGVAGLNVARLLAAAAVSFEIFEARDRLGGRVLTVDRTGAPSTDGYDLGPSWFWPRLQPAIAALVAELGLPAYPQNSDGDVVFERMSREPAGRYAGVPQAPQTWRLAGGSGALVQALARAIPDDRVHLHSRVTRLERTDHGVTVTYRGQSKSERSIQAEHVVAALPPRLLEATVEFDPPLPTESSMQWRGTPTWMAAQAKFFACYDSPFWRADGLSGTAQSMVGPMLEIHDATTSSGSAALFGFIGVGPAERQAIGEQALTEACIAQLARVFGPEASMPVATVLKDWAADPLTATDDDPVSTGHPPPVSTWVHGPWASRLLLAGSETSPTEAGYLSGAVEASTLAAEIVGMSHQRQART